MTHPSNRRQFLRAAAGVAAVGPFITRAGAAPPGGRVRLGFIGSGGRARQIIPMFLSSGDCEIAAICDVIESRMEETAQRLVSMRNKQNPDKVVDYRRLLDRKDIDAVVVATCQHRHADPFIHACQAGKHVFVEKPLSYDVREGRAMVTAAKKAGVAAMMGTQQRAGAHFQKAVELVRAGRLGKVHLVECWNCHNSQGRTGKAADQPKPPPGYHWDEWLGPAPLVPFNDSRLRSNWWLDYSGGMLADWGVHLFDIALWVMGAKSPAAVSCTGGKFHVDDIADAPDTIECTWEFPENWLLRYSYRGFNNFQPVQSRPHHHGLIFHGTKAALAIDRWGYQLYDESNPKEVAKSMRGEPYFAEATPMKSEQDGPWHRHFVKCVKGEAKPPVDLEESHCSTVLCHLGNVAYLTGRRIKWDGEREQVVGEPVDSKVAPTLDRPRRKGYELPNV